MILGEGKDDRKKSKKYHYGTAYERMTSPGREALREHILTPQADKKKAKIVKNPKEEEKVSPEKERDKSPGYSPSFVNSDNGSFVRRKNKIEDDEEVKFPASSRVDNDRDNFSIDLKDVFDRETRVLPSSSSKYGIDK